MKFEEGEIQVYNKGAGFNLDGKAKVMSGEELYYPELATGHMRTSDKYNTTDKRITGGTNGIGMKATNIFSEYFTIVTSDGKRKFTKKYYNGMRRSDPAVLEDYKESGFTKIVFRPDYKSLGFDELTPEKLDILRCLVMTRTVQIASFVKIPVYFNKTLVKTDQFVDFCRLHLKPDDKILEFNLCESMPFKNENLTICRDPQAFITV